MSRPWRPLLLGLWMSALFWPFAHAGGYNHPALLALAPFLFSGADLWDHWVLRWLTWIAALYVELSLAWSQWVLPRILGRVFGGAVHQLFFLPFQQWNQMNAHLAAPLLLLGGLLAWLIFRQCRRYGQAFGLFIVGALVIPANHVLWNLPAELALGAYLILGLFVLIDFHREGLSDGSLTVAGPRFTYGVWGVAAFIPLIIGWQTPSHHSSDPLGVFKGQILPGIRTSQTLATTGYGPGITHIGRSLVASRSPVFLAKTTRATYWQAAVYSHFDGTDWTNPGSGQTYFSDPGDLGIPLITPYFAKTMPVKTVHAAITDLAAGSFPTLFYTGVPTHFSVPAVVHTASARFQPHNVRHYRLTAQVPLENLSNIRSAPFQEAPAAKFSPELELPSNLSPKVAEMAKRITASAVGPWQAAEEIKRYLDRHYRYSLTVTPTNGNVVNHFLFVDKKGYCDQFSTTFIMMMRSLGVPARWVVGYSSGQYDPSRHGYVVRAIDAHSWAQIWIPGSGWVPFDPTPGFSAPLAAQSVGGSTQPSTIGASTPPVTPTPSTNPGTTAHRRRINPGMPPGSHNTPRTASNSSNASNASTHRTASAFHLWELAALLLLVFALAALVRQNHQRSTAATRLWVQIGGISKRRLGTRWHQKSPRQWGHDWVRYFPNDADIIWPLVKLLEAAFYGGTALTQAEERELHALWLRLKQRARKKVS